VAGIREEKDSELGDIMIRTQKKLFILFHFIDEVIEA
jgi:hypothetical protein